jgi:hypothetical protein
MTHPFIPGFSGFKKEETSRRARGKAKKPCRAKTKQLLNEEKHHTNQPNHLSSCFFVCFFWIVLSNKHDPQHSPPLFLCDLAAQWRGKHFGQHHAHTI